MGAQEWALALLGIGFLSERLKAGVGLGQLGTGVQTLIAAPLTGTGAGLSAFGKGITDIIKPFGDIGRGINNFLKSLPAWLIPQGLPWVSPGVGTNGNGNGVIPPPPTNGIPPLIPMSGGDDTSDYTGGGGNVPTGYTFTPIAPSPFILQHYDVMSGLDPYGTAGWYVSNEPNQSQPAGGSANL